MIFRIAKAAAAFAAALAATWIALALVLYLLLYRTIGDIYAKQVRDIVQVTCGRLVPDTLVYTLKPGDCRFANPEFDTRLEVDADGFRNSSGHADTGLIKVAVLGDSHAMGWGVDQSETIASLIARDKRFNVRDLSMSSYGTPRELTAFSRHAADADIVVIQYCDNDRAENAAWLAGPAAFEASAPERARAYAEVAERHVKGAAANAAYRRTMERILAAIAATWRVMYLPPRTPSTTPAPVLAEEARLFAGVMATFKPQLAGKTVIVFDSHPRRPRPGFASAFRAALDKEALGSVKVLDLTGVIGAYDFYHIDEHMRASGHAKVAQRILAEIGNQPVPKRSP